MKTLFSSVIFCALISAASFSFAGDEQLGINVKSIGGGYPKTVAHHGEVELSGSSVRVFKMAIDRVDIYHNGGTISVRFARSGSSIVEMTVYSRTVNTTVSFSDPAAVRAALSCIPNETGLSYSEVSTAINAYKNSIPFHRLDAEMENFVLLEVVDSLVYCGSYSISSTHLSRLQTRMNKSNALK